MAGPVLESPGVYHRQVTPPPRASAAKLGSRVSKPPSDLKCGSECGSTSRQRGGRLSEQRDRVHRG